MNEHPLPCLASIMPLTWPGPRVGILVKLSPSFALLVFRSVYELSVQRQKRWCVHDEDGEGEVLVKEDRICVVLLSECVRVLCSV